MGNQNKPAATSHAIPVYTENIDNVDNEVPQIVLEREDLRDKPVLEYRTVAQLQEDIEQKKLHIDGLHKFTIVPDQVGMTPTARYMENCTLLHAAVIAKRPDFVNYIISLGPTVPETAKFIDTHRGTTTTIIIVMIGVTPLHALILSAFDYRYWTHNMTRILFKLIQFGFDPADKVDLLEHTCVYTEQLGVPPYTNSVAATLDVLGLYNYMRLSYPEYFERLLKMCKTNIVRTEQFSDVLIIWN